MSDHDELEAAVAEFVGALEEVFGRDWAYSKSCLTAIEPVRHFFIQPEATFLEPGVADEEENWGARGVLLEKYRRLREVMERRSLIPKPPFPHRRA